MARRILIAVLALLACTSPALAVDGVDSILIPTGQRVDTWKVNVGGTDVQRQRYILCGVGATDCAEVVNSSLKVNPRDASGNAYSSTLVGSVRTYPVSIYDGSGNQITSFGGTSIADSAVFTRGSTFVTPAGYVYETSDPTLTAGKINVPRLSSKGYAFAVVPDAGKTTYALKNNSSNSTNATSITASATVLYKVQCSNVGSSAYWLKVYAKASAPTVGTDVPVWQVCVPGTGGGCSGRESGDVPDGIAVATGLAVATTTGISDTDTGAVTQATMYCNIAYAAAS